MKKELSRAYIALAIVSFFWGTTYIASRIGAQHMPGLFMAGIRQFSSGINIGRFLPGKRIFIAEQRNNAEDLHTGNISPLFCQWISDLVTGIYQQRTGGYYCGTGSTVCYSFFNMAFTLHKNFKTDDPWDDHWPRRCCHYILRLPWANTQQVVCFWSCACTPLDIELVIWHSILFKAKIIY